MPVLHPRELGIRRTFDPRPTLREKLQRVDCLACGKCCREIQYFLLPPNDQNRRLFMRQLRSANPSFAVNSLPHRHLAVLMDQPGCSLLTAGNRCSEYPTRPSICRGYPFTTVPGDAGVVTSRARVEIEGVLASLVSDCPPIKELKDLGAGYLLEEEIANVHREGTRVVSVTEGLPFLGPALQELLMTILAWPPFGHNDLCVMPGSGKVYYPIF